MTLKRATTRLTSTSAHRTIAIGLRFMYERCCRLEPQLSTAACSTRAIAEVQAHRAPPIATLPHLHRVLAKPIRETGPTKTFPADLTSRLDVFCALPAEMARRAVRVTGHLTVPSFEERGLRDGPERSIALIGYKMLSGVLLIKAEA